MKKVFIYTLLISIPSLHSHSQELDTVYLENPSFEGSPACCRLPSGWYHRNHDKETPPDTHPGFDNEGRPFFEVTTPPYDGKTYIGMVVRENNTYEWATQYLEEPLLKNKCYSFNIYLCRSKFYIGAKDTIKPYEYLNAKEPVIFRMWGYSERPGEKQLLATSEPINHVEWEKYEVEFKAYYDIVLIRLEAYFNPSKLFPYNGNILMDNASDFYEIDCSLFKK